MPTGNDDYDSALRLFEDADEFPIFPFFTANQADKKALNFPGSNNFSIINATPLLQIYSAGIRDYNAADNGYITNESFKKLRIGLRSRIIKEATTSIRTRTNSGIWIIIPQGARFRRRTPTPARTVEKSPTVPGFTTPSLAPPTGRLWKTWQVWFRVKTTRSNSIRSRFPVGTTSPSTT